MKNAGAVNCWKDVESHSEMHVDQMLLSECDESKVPSERNQIQGSNLFFFFFLPCSSPIFHPGHDLFAALTVAAHLLCHVQRTHVHHHTFNFAPSHWYKNHILQQKTKGKERWWNILLSKQLQTQFCKNTQVLQTHMRHVGMSSVHPVNTTATKHGTTVGILPLFEKLGLLVQSEEGSTSYLADKKQGTAAVATATRLTRLTKLASLVQGTRCC